MKIISLVMMLCIGIVYPMNIFCQQTPTCGDWELISWSQISPCDHFEHGGWQLIYENDFENGSLDTTFWYTCNDGWNHTHGNEPQYYLNENIVIENGLLYLIVKREPGYYYNNATGSYSYFEYTSGWIQSKAEFQYGKYEIRCKIPAGQGLWPAFWFYGSEGEIDVYEFNCQNTHKHHMTIHNWPHNASHEQCHTTWISSCGFDDEFHTFSLEWDDFKLIYRVDGIVKRVDYKFLIPNGQAGLVDCEHFSSGLYLRNPFFPKGPQSIRINVAISSGGFGPAPNSQTIFPASLEIDYIKIFKKNNVGKSISISDFDNTNHSDIYTADTIIIANSNNPIIIDADQYVVVAANKEIVINHDFVVANGGAFRACIFNSREDDSPNPIVIDNNSKQLFKLTDNHSFFNVFPNPCSNRLFISTDKDVDYAVDVYDSTGEKTFSTASSPQNIKSIDVSKLSNGCYFVVIHNNNDLNETYKVIVSH